MFVFSKTSFATKLVLLIALTSATAVVLVCVVMAGVTYLNLRAAPFGTCSARPK